MTYTAASSPFVPFGQGQPRGLDAAEIGTHGEHIDRLVRLGLPTVPGITIPLSRTPQLAKPEVAAEAIDLLQQIALRRLDDRDRPILIRMSCSAAFPTSVLPPTIPVLGVEDRNLPLLLDLLGERERLFKSWGDSIRIIGCEVLGITADVFDEIQHIGGDPEAMVTTMREVCADGPVGAYPDTAPHQVALAASAMLNRWTSSRSMRARRAQQIPDNAGIAIHLEAIRIGPWDRSGRGKATSRNSETGEPHPTGIFYPGLGVTVSGTHGQDLDALPGGLEVLNQALLTLESHYREVVEIEFEIRDGRFAIVSSHPVKSPSARATVRLAADLAEAGTIDRALAVMSLHPNVVQELLHTQVVLSGMEEAFAFGLAASPGAATGHVSLSSHDALARIADGGKPILFVEATTPADVPALLGSEAVVTTTGGLASHAAVVARGTGRPAVCSVTKVRLEADRVLCDGRALVQGDAITVDGTSGTIYVGKVDIRPAEPTEELARLLSWADNHRRLGVRANADTPRDVKTALSFGAEGIGLCRTEHQFLGDRLPLIRALLLAENDKAVTEALHNLFLAQREDFTSLLLALGNRPITVRLLDAPLHEFIPPHGPYETSEQALRAGDLHEENPMLGLRGVRLALLHEQLYPTQARALFSAWVDVSAQGIAPKLEVMIPLISLPSELDVARQFVRTAHEEVLEATGLNVPYDFGCMIETPRAALLAGKLAEHVDFMSFGTNDLTQLTFGFSRDDIERTVIQTYASRGVLEVSPFVRLDGQGVGRLIDWAATAARQVKPDIKLGLCGEHGGDPQSIDLIEKFNLSYVSCSPPRVPIARLSAAHAILKAK